MDEISEVVPLRDPPQYNISNFNVNPVKVKYVFKPTIPDYIIKNELFVGCIDDSLKNILNITDGRYEEGKEWEKMEPVGSGTSAIVYKAIDKTFNTIFAVKEYKKEKDEDPMYEVVLLCRLDHCNILAFYGVLHTSTTFYMLTEFIDGQTLKVIIEDKRRNKEYFTISWVMHIFRQILDAMCYFHDKNVVHYDLKDFNIMVLPDDSVRIIDFGNSKIDETEANPNIDLDCVTRILLKLLQQTPTKKKESFEDKRLKTILTKLYQENRGPPPIGKHHIPRCVIPIVKIGFGFDQQAKKKRTAKELRNNISAEFIRKISQAAGPKTSLQPTQHEQTNDPIPDPETGDSGDLAASASCNSSEVNTPSTDLPDTMLDDTTEAHSTDLTA